MIHMHCFNGHFPVEPGLAIYCLIIRGVEASFLRMGCYSPRPTNNVKALKINNNVPALQCYILAVY